MNHLLKVEPTEEEQVEQKKKPRGGGVFGKVAGIGKLKDKDKLREEKTALPGKKRRKGKGIQL